jgi:hypothetical protein
MTEAPLSRAIPGLNERRRDFLARLQAERPAYILMGLRDENGWEPLDSYTEMVRFAEFDAFVRAHYTPIGEIGNFIVGRRMEASWRAH